MTFVLRQLATEKVDSMFFIDVLQVCYCNRFKQQRGVGGAVTGATFSDIKANSPQNSP
jgi:hypothetical protein